MFSFKKKSEGIQLVFHCFLYFIEGSSRCDMANLLIYDIVVNEFEFHLYY